jgi:hypothetical protein
MWQCATVKCPQYSEQNYVVIPYALVVHQTQVTKLGPTTRAHIQDTHS